MSQLPPSSDPRLLVGIETNDDAGVFLLSEGVALVQTVDFFTPIVDDPYEYGAIAVANSLSDIYAMGATPLTALNIVGFPATTLPISILAEILRGGADKAREAGVTILGGHSVKDPELKYGMAVTAVADPKTIVRNSTACIGHRLLLTKPLGTGILTTALKREKLVPADLAEVTASMMRLNRLASEVMLRFHASACTDVTGFGLFGHLSEIAKGSGVSVHLDLEAIPVFARALDFARESVVPGGLKDNRRYYSPLLDRAPDLDEARFDLLFDPQTSGGLLFCVPPDQADACLQALHQGGETASAIIGTILSPQEKLILLR